MPLLHDLPRARRADRETLLCLHCSGSSGRQWDSWAAALGSRIELLAPSLIGYRAGDDWPVGRRASLDEEVDRLAPPRRPRPRGLHLMGHSYGGAVALQFALRHPRRVQSLTLFEPVRFALLAGTPEWDDIVGVGREIGAQVRAGRHDDAGRLFVDYWSGHGSWQALPDSRRRLFAERMPKVHGEFETLFADALPAARYSELTMPVTLIGGTHSPQPARAVLDVLAARLPRARRVVLRGAGHMAPVTDPLAVMAELPPGLGQEPLALAA